MKKLKPWIIGIILFFVFGWSPVFYIGLFLYVFIKICTKPTNNVTKTVTNTNVPNTQGIVLKCTKCDSVLTINQKFCGKCGEAFDGNNVKVEYDATIDKPIINNAVQSFVKPGSFDKMFGLSEDEMLEEFINRELVKAQIDKTSKLIPHDILKRKRIFNIIFSLLIFIYISLIFFHFPLLTYVIGIITLFIFYKLTRKYDLMKYLKKQLKARPSERVSNIVMSVKSTFTEDTSKKFLLPSILIGLILPFFE